MEGPSSRTLQRALDAVGTRERLAELLSISLEDLEEYLAGRKAIPNQLFLAALDIVARRV
jgi:hypothetical protein